jgi:hypothetical protein
MQSRITKRAVDAAAAVGAHDHWLWDSELKGFGLHVWPSGQKVHIAAGAAFRNGAYRSARTDRLGRQTWPGTARLLLER